MSQCSQFAVQVVPVCCPSGLSLQSQQCQIRTPVAPVCSFCGASLQLQWHQFATPVAPVCWLLWSEFSASVVPVCNLSGASLHCSHSGAIFQPQCCQFAATVVSVCSVFSYTSSCLNWVVRQPTCFIHCCFSSSIFLNILSPAAARPLGSACLMRLSAASWINTTSLLQADLFAQWAPPPSTTLLTPDDSCEVNDGFLSSDRQPRCYMLRRHSSLFVSLACFSCGQGGRCVSGVGGWGDGGGGGSLTG